MAKQTTTGRPGKYETQVKPKLFLVENWAKDGLTDEEIAGRLDIAVSTLYNYKLEHLEFLEALKRGKEIVDYEVEQKLLKRAMGYEYVETTQEPDADGIMRVTKEVTKTVLPDTTAQIFWLKNRKPDEWRDKQENSVTINNGAETFSDYVKGILGKDGKSNG